jgi:hypothetical protein
MLGLTAFTLKCTNYKLKLTSYKLKLKTHKLKCTTYKLKFNSNMLGGLQTCLQTLAQTEKVCRGKTL